MSLAKPADSFCSSSSVEEAPELISIVTFGCRVWNSAARPSRIVSASSLWPVHQVRVTGASGLTVAFGASAGPVQAARPRVAAAAMAMAARRRRVVVMGLVPSRHLLQ